MTLVSIPPNPVPDQVVTGHIKTADGVSLRFARWAPPANRRGTVCLLNGRTEFIEKYFETVRDLRSRGFAVATFDWRGQGGSQRLIPEDPHKGHINDFAEYETDLEAFMRDVVLPDCPPPVFALAHSMGATALVRASHKGSRWFERIVLSSPMLSLYNVRSMRLVRHWTRAMRWSGLGRNYLPRRNSTMSLTAPFVGNMLTSDPVRYARNAAILEAEPTLAVGWPTVAWMDAALRAMLEVMQPAYVTSMRQPMLIVAAGADTIVKTSAIEDFGMRLRTASHLVVPGARHELLMEQDRIRNQFWAAFDAFIPGTPLR